VAELAVAAQHAFEGRESGVGCDEKAALDRTSLYYPTRPGAKWVYEVQARKTTTEISETVAKVEENGAGFRVTTEREGVGGNVRGVTEVSATGVYQAEFAGSVYPEPIPSLKLPAKAGDSWTTDLNVPAAAMAKIRFTYAVRGGGGGGGSGGQVQGSPCRVEDRRERTGPDSDALVRAGCRPGQGGHVFWWGRADAGAEVVPRGEVARTWMQVLANSGPKRSGGAIRGDRAPVRPAFGAAVCTQPSGAGSTEVRRVLAMRPDSL
jgi:hypothetical protein